MITLNAKTTYHQCVIDATNKTKQLFTRSITAEIWNTFEPIIKKLNKNSDNNPITNILEKYNKYRTQNQETNNDNKYIHIERTWESKKSIKT